MGVNCFGGEENETDVEVVMNVLNATELFSLNN